MVNFLFADGPEPITGERSGSDASRDNEHNLHVLMSFIKLYHKFQQCEKVSNEWHNESKPLRKKGTLHELTCCPAVLVLKT